MALVEYQGYIGHSYRISNPLGTLGQLKQRTGFRALMNSHDILLPMNRDFKIQAKNIFKNLARR